MKKILSALLLSAILLSLIGQACAEDGSIARTVIGADLSDEEIELVYHSFGIQRGAISELIMTNELERKYLEGAVDDDVIGTRSVSCVYVELAPVGSGIQVSTTGNITYFTPEMYKSALTTAGITDLKVIVDAPFQVSGTGALAGIYYAVEDLSGMTLDELSKSVSGQELTVTGELADSIGSMDATDIVSDIKDGLGDTAEMSDEQLHDMILGIARQYNVSLSDGQIDKLILLCRSLLSLDASGLLKKVEEMQGTIHRVSDATSKVISFFDRVKSIFSSIAVFFGKIKSVFA